MLTILFSLWYSLYCCENFLYPCEQAMGEGLDKSRRDAARGASCSACGAVTSSLLHRWMDASHPLLVALYSLVAVGPGAAVEELNLVDSLTALAVAFGLCVRGRDNVGRLSRVWWWVL